MMSWTASNSDTLPLEYTFDDGDAHYTLKARAVLA